MDIKITIIGTADEAALNSINLDVAEGDEQRAAVLIKTWLVGNLPLDLADHVDVTVIVERVDGIRDTDPLGRALSDPAIERAARAGDIG